MSDVAKHVEALISQATASEKSEDALRFSQSALNVANANRVLVETELEMNKG